MVNQPTSESGNGQTHGLNRGGTLYDLPVIGPEQGSALDGTVTVRADELVPGRLPPVCVKRGVIATDWQPTRFTTTPRWTLILLLFGVLPYLIAWAMTRLVATGALPVSAEALLAMRRLRTQTVALSAAGIALFVGAALLRIGVLSAVVAMLGLFCFFAAIVLQLVVGPAVTVGGTVFRGPNGILVVLRRVHPGFIEAVHRRHAGDGRPHAP